MTVARCIGDPISWLRIERYVLGELPEPDSEAIREHIERCVVCRSCVESASEPRMLTALPPPVARTSVVRPKPVHRSRRRLAIVSSTLALAAAVAFAVFPTDAPIAPAPRVDARPRGGDVAMVLVRNRDGEITENPESFDERDRFRVLVTCPPGSDEHVRVLVVQGGEASLALESDPDFRCGNRVPLEGAFRITGSVDTRVCVALGAIPSTAGDAAVAPFLGSTGSETLCRSMRSEREP